MSDQIRRWVLAAGVGAATTGAAAAQPAADPFDRARAVIAVADQKAEASVREIVAEADRAARTDPAAAAQRLQRPLASLDLSSDVSSAKRNELAAVLQGRVAALRGAPAGSTPAKPKAEPGRADHGLTQEARDVRDAIAQVEKATALNNPKAARAQILVISQKYPNNPAVLALAGQGSLGDRVADAKQLAAEQEKGVLFALNDVQRSATPPRGDIEFPKNWKEIVARRALDEPKIGPDEEAILRSLEKSVGSGIKDGPFLETIQTLSNLIGKEIYLDRKSLDEAGLDLQRPVTLPGGVTARTALRAVLQTQGLTFVIKDKLIQVVTLEKAQTLQVTRAYYLGELVTGTSALPGGAPVWGPAVDFMQTQANAQAIVDSITQSIDPLVWKGKGGPATITFNAATASLIVRAPSEVHASFGSKLSRR